jgi:hypothetical protein
MLVTYFVSGKQRGKCYQPPAALIVWGNNEELTLHAISPDSTRIVYRSCWSQPEQNGIFTMNMDRTGQQKIPTPGVSVHSPMLTPNGRHIIVRDFNSDGKYIMDRDGRNLQPLDPRTDPFKVVENRERTFRIQQCVPDKVNVARQ